MALVGGPGPRGASQHASLSARAVGGLTVFYKEIAAYEEAKRRLTRAASSATPQTDLSQTPGLQAAIKAGVLCELKKQLASGEEAHDSGKGRGREKRGPSLESRGVTENDGGGWQLFREIGERSPLAPSCRTWSARSPSTLPTFWSQVRSSLCPSSSGVVHQRRGCMNPADRLHSSVA